MSRSSDKRRARRPLVIGLLVAALLIAFGAWYWLQTRQASSPTDANEPVSYSTDRPDEDKPEGYVSTAGPDEPKYIRLPTIGTEGFVQKVGVDQRQQIAVPTNIHLAGWYVQAAKPAQPGLSIIDGHVDGQRNQGIFFQLNNLEPGDEYEVERGDGLIKRFRVMEVTTVDNKDAANILFSQKPSVGSQLNLITCGGDFDPARREYDKRVIVTSELIN